MAIMMEDPRAALLGVGATDEMAKALTAVATCEARWASIETRLGVLIWTSGATLAVADDPVSHLSLSSGS